MLLGVLERARINQRGFVFFFGRADLKGGTLFVYVLDVGPERGVFQRGLF